MQHGYRQSNTRLEPQICCTSAGVLPTSDHLLIGWMRWGLHRIRPCGSRSRMIVLFLMRKTVVWKLAHRIKFQQPLAQLHMAVMAAICGLRATIPGIADYLLFGTIPDKDDRDYGCLQSRYGSGMDWQGDCQTGWSSGHVKEICQEPHEPCSFSHGCRRIGSYPSMIFREQAPKRQPDFVSAWLVACAEMV